MKFRVDIIRKLKVVHNSVEHLVYFAWRCQQADTLQPINHVHFSLATPLTSRIKGRAVLSLCIGLLLNGSQGFNGDGAEFCLTMLTGEIVAPEAGLSLEAQVAQK